MPLCLRRHARPYHGHCPRPCFPPLVAPRPITERLIARDGKLVTIQNQAGEAPNGTSFMITRTSAPDLDRTNLVVGRVVEGMDVVEKLAGLPYSKPRTEWYDGPFFE
eukprot:364925-Chlamydomonas_euryale.AAC.5